VLHPCGVRGGAPAPLSGRRWYGCRLPLRPAQTTTSAGPSGAAWALTSLIAAKFPRLRRVQNRLGVDGARRLETRSDAASAHSCEVDAGRLPSSNARANAHARRPQTTFRAGWACSSHARDSLVASAGPPGGRICGARGWTGRRTVRGFALVLAAGTQQKHAICAGESVAAATGTRRRG
jgi:hypothetical protein